MANHRSNKSYTDLPDEIFQEATGQGRLMRRKAEFQCTCYAGLNIVRRKPSSLPSIFHFTELKIAPGLMQPTWMA